MAEKKTMGLGVEVDGPEGKLPTYDGIVNDPEMEGLTLYEKKALLVNRELDSEYMCLVVVLFSRGTSGDLCDRCIT